MSLRSYPFGNLARADLFARLGARGVEVPPVAMVLLIVGEIGGFGVPLAGFIAGQLL